MTRMTRKSRTKIGTVQAMLTRPKGATIAALCKTTGWQAHSVRAALTGLRKAGHHIEREDGGDAKGQTSVYRITNAPGTRS